MVGKAWFRFLLIFHQPLFVSSGAREIREEQGVADELRLLESDAARLADEGKFRQGVPPLSRRDCLRPNDPLGASRTSCFARTLLDVL